MSNAQDQFKNKKFYIKLIHVILAIVNTGLMSDSIGLADNIIKQQVVIGTIIGYLIASIIVVATYIIDGKMNKSVELLITITGAILQITSGALVFEFMESIYSIVLPDKNYAVGGFCIASAAVYIIDSIIIFLNKQS